MMLVPAAGAAQWRDSTWASVRLEAAAPDSAAALSPDAEEISPAVVSFPGAAVVASERRGPSLRGAVRGALIGGLVTGAAGLVIQSAGYGWDCGPNEFAPCPVAVAWVFGLYATPGVIVGAVAGGAF